MSTVAQRLAVAMQGYRRFDALVADLGPDDLDRTTRLAGWVVRDLVAHVAWGQAMEADAIRRAGRAEASPAQVNPLSASGELAELTSSVRAGLRAFEAAVAQVSEQPLQGAVPLPTGPLPPQTAATLFAVEAALHTSDLETALGGAGRLAPDAVAACVDFMPALLGFVGPFGQPAPDGTAITLAGEQLRLTVVRQAGAWTISEQPGPASVTVAGSDEALVLFTFGRLPDTTATVGLTVDGDIELARRFKEFFPGP